MPVKLSKAKKKMSKPVANYAKWEKAILVPISELVFADWNCNEMDETQLAELTADIENQVDPSDPHFDEPLQIVPLKTKAEENKWLVLGGYHRSKVMTGLDQAVIPCVVRHDLADKSREELMAWTVRRNNLRGKVNAQKYAQIEDALIDSGGLSKEAARKSMMMDEDLAEALRASLPQKRPDNGSSGNLPDNSGDGGFESDSERDAYEAQKSRDSLLQALKIAEQDVLLDSADTVEHGYLFFAQGNKGQMHLVVNESKRLYGLVSKMVSACKGNSAKVDDFISAAIQQELQNWE
jgi:hypothetical protein